MSEATVSQTELAEMFNLSRERMREILRKAALPYTVQDTYLPGHVNQYAYDRDDAIAAVEKYLASLRPPDVKQRGVPKMASLLVDRNAFLYFPGERCEYCGGTLFVQGPLQRGPGIVEHRRKEYACCCLCVKRALRFMGKMIMESKAKEG